MKRIITELDGARVLYKTNNDPSNVYGWSGKKAITALAICQYADNDNVTYLFACDRHWKVIGDLAYSSIEEAMKDAERYYQVQSIIWLQVISDGHRPTNT